MTINNQPIVFNIQYTTFEPRKKASDFERNEHATQRAFFDMTGDDNIYRYITTEGKRVGQFTALEYLQKNTGVFDQNGMIPQERVDEMKARLKENKGNIWHGFISFNEHDSELIDSPEKCVRLIKRVFPSFLRDAKLKPSNTDLMCALHLDRPHHLHIHFVFWEKEAKFKGKDGELEYRKRGRIEKDAMDNMFVRLGLFVDDEKDKLHITRDNALQMLRKTTGVKVAMYSKDEIRNEILSLAKDLPKTGRLQYGSEDMKPYRARVDKIVSMLLDYDKEARAADLRFHDTLSEKREIIANICRTPQALANVNASPQAIEKNLPKYHFKIDESKIDIVEKVAEDYKRRQGNLVLNLCKFIKPEYFERKPGKKYKPNDNRLKRRLSISGKSVSRRFDKFFASLGGECNYLERDFSHRLQDIEKEIEREREQRKEEEARANYKKEGNKKE